MRVAAIDIGTNTVLLLIAELGEGGKLVPIVDLAEITRLGQGLDRTRTLAPAAVERTLECLRGYAAQIAENSVDRTDVVGTSAMRDAGDARDSGSSEFVKRAGEILGVLPRVISGADEASLAFSGGLLDLGLEGPVTAFDIGGGSTELMRGHVAPGMALVEEQRSLDVGSVRLFERHVRADPPNAREMSVVRAFVLDKLLAVAAPPRHQPLVGMAGTVTTLAAIARSIDPYDRARIHGLRLSAREIAETAQRLSMLSLAERKNVLGLQEKRADVIPIGAAIVEAILAWARADEVIVSDRGVRWGVALQAARACETGTSAKRGA